MIKIFGQIDTVADPVVFTPWFWRHMSNSMCGFILIYSSFIFLKYIYNRYPIKTNKKQYILFYFLIQYQVLMCAKPHKYDTNILFSIANALFIYKITEKYYLGQNKKYINEKIFLDKYFSKKYNGEYNTIQPFSQNSIFSISLWIWFYSHTVYEYYTAGDQGRDSWWEATGNAGPPPSTDILSNSYPNSVGDTIGGFIGCLFVIVTIKKYGLCWGVPLSFWSMIYTGPACVEIYRNMGWRID